MKLLIIGVVSALGAGALILFLFRRILNFAHQSGKDSILSDLRAKEAKLNEERHKLQEQIRREYEKLKSDIPNDWDTIKRLRQAKADSEPSD